MCDVTQDDQLAKLFDELKEKYGVLYGLVHSIGFAPDADLKGDFVNTTREGFRIANDISVYSLIAVARGALPLMTSGGSIVTLTYYGAEKVVPRYNVMGVAKAALEATVRYLADGLGPKGIRVNAISAGPIKSLASRGISNFGEMLKTQVERAPLKRNVDPAEVGATAAFLLSDGGSGITGETIYVDCGYNIMGFLGSRQSTGQSRNLLGADRQQGARTQRQCSRGASARRPRPGMSAQPHRLAAIRSKVSRFFSDECPN